MNSQAPTSKIYGFQKIKPRKRRMAFFVLLGVVLVMGFLANVSITDAAYDTNQTYDLKTTYKLSPTEISTMEKNKVDFNDFVKKVNDQMTYSAYKNAPGAAAESVYKDLTDPNAELQGEAWGVANPTNTEKWLAAKAMNWISSTLFAPIIAVLYIIGLFCMMFLNMAAYFLDSMLSPTLYNFANEEIIIKGWTAVRDVCNLFFLLILLFIAFCTILQIEKYHAKKILLTFILMALLINFSKPIAIFIFDGSQLLMNFFLNKLKGDNTSFSASLSGTSKIAETLWNDKSLSWFGNNTSAPQLAVQYIFADIFIFMLAVAYFVMSIYLLIRIIALWILIILSPFAFLFNAVPDFKKISSDWWDALFKYSYVGPAIAFFLWLSTFLAKTSLSQSMNKQLGAGGSALETNSDAFLTWVVQFIIPFFVVIVFLYASIIVAQKFGIAFASAITSRANKALSFFPRKGWAGTKWGARKGVSWFNREKLAKWGVSPTVWRDAWVNRTKEREEDVFGDAQARASDKLSGIFKAGRKPPDFYKRRREAEKDAKYKKEQDTMGTSAEIVLEGLRNLYNEKNMDPGEKLSRARAFLSTLISSRDFNEAVKQDALSIIGMGKDMDAGNTPQDMRAIMAAFGMTDEKDQAYYARRYGETAFANKDWHLWNAEETDPEKRKDNLYGKLGVIDKQQFQIGVHAEAIYTKNDKGEVTGMSGTALPFIKRLNETGGEYFSRMRSQVLSGTFKEGGIEAMKLMYDKLISDGNTKDAAEIKTFVHLMANNSAKDTSVKDFNKKRLEEAGWINTKAPDAPWS